MYFLFLGGGICYSILFCRLIFRIFFERIDCFQDKAGKAGVIMKTIILFAEKTWFYDIRMDAGEGRGMGENRRVMIGRS